VIQFAKKQELDMKLQTSVRVDEGFYNDSKKVFDAFGLSFGIIPQEKQTIF